MLPMVYAVAWLCLLHAALATIVQDNSTDISYDGNWIEDRNNYYSGGTVHRTNISGATARYSFTGVAVTLYGTIQHDGANFSFIVNGAPPQLCTSQQNGSDVFGSELCSIGNLDGTGQHTLTIQHTDPSGGWLAIDYLDVASPHRWPSLDKFPIKWKYAVASLFIGLIVGAIVTSCICQCCRRARKRRPSFSVTAVTASSN